MPKTPPIKDPKDGFDLVEYPCDFVFKAMCRADESESAREHIVRLIKTKIDDAALLKLSGNESRTGKFESVSATIHINNREELEKIYAVISASPRVVMTL